MMQVRRDELLHRIAIFGVGILILTAKVLSGQETAVTILGRQGMHTVLETEIGSLTSHPGDKFAMRLLEPVIVNNREVLPKGPFAVKGVSLPTPTLAMNTKRTAPFSCRSTIGLPGILVM
jgi:hypothetical protein